LLDKKIDEGTGLFNLLFPQLLEIEITEIKKKKIEKEFL